MNEELTDFLNRHDGACSGGIARLDSLGAETLEDAWEKASPADLVWAVTRPGVMSPEQRRQFLVFVLGSIEDKLTDPRSKNILEKLRTNEPITAADAARAAAAEARAAWAAADAADAARAAAEAAADAAWAAAADAAAARAEDASWASWAAERAAQADAREQQARWIRTNFRLADLRTK